MIGFLRRRRIFWLVVLLATLVLFLFGWYTSLQDLRQSAEVFFPPPTPFEVEENFPENPEDFPEPLENTTPQDHEINAEFFIPNDVEEIRITDDNKIDTMTEFEGGIKSNSSELRFQQLTLPEPIMKNIKKQGDLQTMPSSHETTFAAFDGFSNPEVTLSSNNRLIINTAGCKLPKFDPWDPTVIDLYNETTGLYPCQGMKSFLLAQNDNSIIVNDTALKKFYNRTIEDLKCSYSNIIRVSQEERNYNREENFSFGEVQDIYFGVPLKEDNVMVICDMPGHGTDDTTLTIKHYFALIQIKDSIESVKAQISPPIPKLDVILIGIDSISKLNFLRHFPKTKKVLEDKMLAFDMMGYTKVGDNTFPNLVPMLTGHHVEHYFNESMMDTMYFDHLDFVWKDYADRGYRTFFAEDHPAAAMFNYNKRGFQNPPTDYYFRPISLAMDYTKAKTDLGHQCLNSESDTHIIFNFLKRFLHVMEDRPIFGFSMVTTTTHDLLNNAGLEDLPTSELLNHMWDVGTLNKSMLVLFSDHGIRFGEIRQRYIGKFEERMPMLYVYFPHWFREQYPDLIKALRTNQKRLVTLFDVHATMLHLLNLDRKSPPGREFSEGLSLLEEIPSQRTCAGANIPPHYCACQTFDKVSVEDEYASKSIQLVIDSMNEKLYGLEKCAHLELDTPMDARLGKVDEQMLKYNYWEYFKDERDAIHHEGQAIPLNTYLVTFKTKPGGGIFEGSVQHNVQNGTFDILGISRINMYGNQSSCIDSPKLKLYCYCEI